MSGMWTPQGRGGGDGCAWIIGGMLVVLLVGIFLAEWLTP